MSEEFSAYQRTNRPAASSLAILATVGAYYGFKKSNFSIRNSYLLPTILAYFPICSISRILFVNKLEDQKFKEMMAAKKKK